MYTTRAPSASTRPPTPPPCTVTSFRTLAGPASSPASSATASNYSVFGTVTTGLEVLDKVAAAGTDDSNGTGDGRPKREITISQVR
jgi:cyclophilin family peptidyl-prolyl cis-trans isomerase